MVTLVECRYQVSMFRTAFLIYIYSKYMRNFSIRKISPNLCIFARCIYRLAHHLHFHRCTAIATMSISDIIKWQANDPEEEYNIQDSCVRLKGNSVVRISST